MWFHRNFLPPPKHRSFDTTDMCSFRFPTKTGSMAYTSTQAEKRYVAVTKGEILLLDRDCRNVQSLRAPTTVYDSRAKQSKHQIVGFALSWQALASYGNKCSGVASYFSRLPRARATNLGRGPNLVRVYRRASCIARGREHEKRPQVGKKK